MRAALTKLRATADNLTAITSPDGSLTKSLANVQELTGRLKSDDGPLFVVLNNLKKTTEDINRDGRITKLLTNFEQVSQRADLAVGNANKLVVGLGPQVNTLMGNLNQMTDTLKRQPWRVIWPSTKKYDAPVNEVAASPSTSRDRRSLDYGTVPANEQKKRR